MKVTDIDMDGFSYPELEELKERIEARMQQMREEAVPALRERFSEEAAALGVTLDEVAGAAKARRGRPRKGNGEEAEAPL